MPDNIFQRLGRAIWPGEDGGDGFDTSQIGAPPEIIDDGWDTVDGVSKSAPTGTIGSTGASTVGGFILSTDRTQPRLQGVKRFEAFAEMVADTSIVAAGVRLFLALIKKADWAVTPAEGQEDNAKATEIAETVEKMMFDMTSSWAKVIGQLAMFRFDGFRILEWTAVRRDDGTIGMMDVEIRPPRTITRWDLDEGGTVKGVWQQTPDMREVYLPREKIVYGVDDTLTEHPEGLGLFRHLVLTSRRLKAFLDIEEIGFDTDLRGIPIAYGPLGALDKQVEDAGNSDTAKATRTRYKKPLTDFINSHVRARRQGLMFDSETYRSADDAQTPSAVKKWSVELLQGDAQSFESMANAVNRLNQEMARVLGVEHLLLGADGGGSLALGRTKVDVLYLTVQSTQSELVEILERDWLGPIADLNGWPDELIPSLAVAEMRAEDVAAVTEALETMARAGAVLQPDDPVVNVVRDMVNLPHVPDDLMARDAALLGDDPNADPAADPDEPMEPKPEAGMQKRANVRWIRSRRSRMRQIAANQAKRAA